MRFSKFGWAAWVAASAAAGTIGTALGTSSVTVTTTGNTASYGSNGNVASAGRISVNSAITNTDVFQANGAAGAFVHRADGQPLHGDAIVHRADVDAQVAGDAFVIHHLEVALAVLFLEDRLVRGVLAGGIAAAALDAEVLVDMGLGHVVQVEVLPVGDVGHGPAAEVLDRGVALLVHPAGQPRLHFLDDAEAIGHGRRAHLHRAAAHRDELGRVAPGGDRDLRQVRATARRLQEHHRVLHARRCGERRASAR